MNTQAVVLAPGLFQTLPAGRVLPLGSTGGRLEVVDGRVWLTRGGDLDDHIVGRGETVVVPASGRALVEAWDGAEPALLRWQAGTLGERIAAAARAAFGRCWDIVDPSRRIGAGSIAAAVALVSGALLFGPLSDARTQALAAPGVLHNGDRPSARLDAGTPKRLPADAARPGARARVVAQEAGRRPPGAA